jgi:hypothetical protein
VTTTPLLMRAGLHPFGADFGNGARDQQYFQRDDEFDRYVAAKADVAAARHAVLDDSAARAAVLDRAFSFVCDRLRQEHDVVVDRTGSRRAQWDRVAQLVQEDLAALHRGVDDVGDTVLLNVCFPSGWRPEKLKAASFQGIHEPVPAFTDKQAVAQSMVRAMVDRGPYVRFVWACCADDALDHHPEEGHRAPWTTATRGFLRVERQTTVPFADVGGALFLIRTYIYPFASLTAEARQTLTTAVAVMGDDVAAYKGLLAGKARILELLRG